MWQHLFADTLGARGSDVAFLALLDESGQAVASEGDRFAPAFSGSRGFVQSQGTRLFGYDKIISIPHAETGGMAGKESGTEPRVVPARLRLGIYASSAASIHLALFGAAIAILIMAISLRRSVRVLFRK